MMKKKSKSTNDLPERIIIKCAYCTNLVIITRSMIEQFPEPSTLIKIKCSGPDKHSNTVSLEKLTRASIVIR